MKIHLVRSSSFSKESYSEILKLLKAQSGPVSFISCPEASHKKVWREEAKLIRQYQPVGGQLVGSFDDQDEEEAKEGVSMEWQELFTLCATFRQSNNIPVEDYVVLLTPFPNPDRWFSSFSDNSRNIFIHTDEWEAYLPCSSIYPISYLVMSQVLQKLFYGNMNKKLALSHRVAVGCMNDFCGHKAQISFKLRTADICPNCIGSMVEAGVRGDIINQAITLFEQARKEMLFRQRFKQLPSRMHISRGNVIHLVDYQNKVIELSPLEKTVYFLFLKHQNGIVLSERAKYKGDIRTFYKKLNVYSPKNESLKEYNEAFNESVDLLVILKENSFSEKVSKINRKLINELGEETAKYYFIDGKGTKKRQVLLDRNLLTCDSDVFDER